MTISPSPSLLQELERRIRQLRSLLQQDADDWRLWRALAEACGRAGYPTLARSAGRQALKLQLPCIPAANTMPPLYPAPAPGNDSPAAPERKPILSMLLRSPSPEARAHVLATLLRLPELLPGWRARLHVETALPSGWLRQLAELGAELRPAARQLPQGLRPFSHLEVLREAQGQRWLLLDDAHPLTPALAEAVRDWQRSDRPWQLHRWCWDQALLVPLAGLACSGGPCPDLLGWLQSQPQLWGQPPMLIEAELSLQLWAALAEAPPSQWDRCFAEDLTVRAATPGGDDTRAAVVATAMATDDPLAAAWLQPWLERFGLTEAGAAARRGASSLLMSRLPWPAGDGSPADASPAATAAAPRPLTGRFINMSSQQRRRSRIEECLAALPWAGAYQRFAAHTATATEAEALGLASAGELGIWRSLLALLEEWLATDPPDAALLHILEDDAVPHPDLAAAAEAVFISQPQLEVLFAEAFLTPELYLDLLAEQQHLAETGPRQLGLLGGEHYLACLSCWFVSGAGARRLLPALKTLFAAIPAAGSRRLPPVDLAIRELIRARRLEAAITLPFLATITTEDDSAIQAGDKALQRSRRLDLQLRRLLYAGDDLCDPAQLLHESLVVAGRTFTAVEQRELIGVVLRHGRSRGWLPAY